LPEAYNFGSAFKTKDQIVFERESMSLYDRLRKAQRDTENPIFFEETLTEAFKRLGFSSKHIGGRDEPDILLDVLGQKIVIDAKTASEPIGEPRIGFPALERYKERYRADHVGVVAIGFRKGVVRATAKKSGVILIETDAICKALENHIKYPYNLKHIYKILFEKGKTVITPRDIEPSTKNMNKQIKMVKRVLSDLERFQRSGKQFNIDDAVVAYRWENPSIKKEQVEEALAFLSSPPLNVVKEENGFYSLTLNFDEMLKRLALLHEALPTPVLISEQKRAEVYRKKLTLSEAKHKFIHVSANVRSLFPKPHVEFTIESNNKKYTVSFDKHSRIIGLSKWYNDNPRVKPGDTVSLQRLRRNVYRLTVE
jgi:hypothetical protein